jgi:hypothetical protein
VNFLAIQQGGTMHPTLSCELAKARIADLHRQAQRDTLARAARRTRHRRPYQPTLPALRIRTAVTRRLLSLLGARTHEPPTAALLSAGQPNRGSGSRRGVIDA